MSMWKLAVIRTAFRAAASVGSWAGDAMLRLDLQRWIRESFDDRDDDIYIAAFPRAGTTWMQMLLYQLATSGELTFRHIYEVSPWLELLHGGPGAAAALGLPPLGDAESLPSPRILKTHAAYSTLPRELKGRFIFVTRDCLDTSVSMLHHVRAYRDPHCEYGEIFDAHLRGGGRSNNWFLYTGEWLVNRWRRPVLVVRYEDMKRDLESVARRIAAFCGLRIDESQLPRILERSSFASMKLHQDKFGEREVRPPKVVDEFIRRGVVGEGREYVSAEQAAYVRRRLRRMPLQAESVQ